MPNPLSTTTRKAGGLHFWPKTGSSTSIQGYKKSNESWIPDQVRNNKGALYAILPERPTGTFAFIAMFFNEQCLLDMAGNDIII